MAGGTEPLVCVLTPVYNGEKLLAQNVYRPCGPDQDRVTLNLKQGKNQLLLKICQGEGEWAFYFAAVFMATWMIFAGFVWGPLHRVDPYPFAFLLFLGNIVQLLLMFVIMVGQQVLGAASDKRAVVTYQDAEAILHECLQMQDHLSAQDVALEALIKRMEKLEARMEKTAG